jgi:hypothetical protein
MDWIELARSCNYGNESWGPLKERNFFNNSVVITFSMGTLLSRQLAKHAFLAVNTIKTRCAK